MEQTITMVLSAIAAVAALILTRYVLPAVSKKVDPDRVAEAVMWAEKAVRWAQDWMGDKTGEVRRKNVLSVMRTINKEKDLGLSDEMIDILVRSAYTVMMEEMAKSYGTEEY